jgi:hypothetical protein
MFYSLRVAFVPVVIFLATIMFIFVFGLYLRSTSSATK